MKSFDETDKTKIKCSSCNKSLVNILHLTKNEKIVSRVQAECPFCDGHSNIEIILGNFYFGPIGEDESVAHTVIEDIIMDSESNVSKFIVRKGKQ